MISHCCGCEDGCSEDDDELGNLYVHPIAVCGTADVRLILTINGDEYSNRRLSRWAELEDNGTGEIRGLLFTELDDEEPSERQQDG